MAIRKGYQYLAVMVAEDTFGTIKTGATTGVAVPDVLDINEIPELVETNTKTLSLEPKKQNALLGAKLVNGKMSGPLTVLHQELLKMLVLDSTKTSPYVIGTDQGAKYSWTLFNYFAIPAAAIKCHNVTGAVLKTLKISGSPGNPNSRMTWTLSERLVCLSRTMASLDTLRPCQLIYVRSCSAKAQSAHFLIPRLRALI